MWFECVEINAGPLWKIMNKKSMSWVCDQRSHPKKETHRWIQTLWNLSLLGFSICLSGMKNSSAAGMFLKKWWDRITYWKWEDCDLMDFKRIWMIWERHFQDQSQDNGILEFARKLCWILGGCQLMEGHWASLRLLGQNQGSPRCLKMISRISPHGHPNLN